MTKLNARELAAVITGLRLLQETYLSSGDVLPFGLLDVATNGGTLKPFCASHCWSEYFMFAE